MRKFFVFLMILLICLSSCQLQKVTVNLYSPPKLVFPPDVRSFLLTSRYVPAKGPYEDVQWGAFESVDSLKWSLSESVVDTLGKRMAAGNLFLIKVRHKPRMLRHNEGNLPEKLPWEGLLNITKKEYVQGIWILEGYDLKKSPVTTTNANGNFSARFNIDVTLAVRAYEPEKMRLIDDSVYTFTSEFRSTAKSEKEAEAGLPDDRKAMFSACSNAADGYFNVIRPGEIASKRYYYPSGDTTLVKGDKAIKAGKWGKAESNWKWLAYNSPDTTIQARASFNMALACERDGRFNQALGFARRSQRLKPSAKTVRYIDLLDKKIRDFENEVAQRKLIKRW